MAIGAHHAISRAFVAALEAPREAVHNAVFNVGVTTENYRVREIAEIVRATVTGAADYEMRIVTRDMHAFDDFLRDKILSLGLVSNIESRIVIRGVKNSTAVPLGLVSPYVSPHG